MSCIGLLSTISTPVLDLNLPNHIIHAGGGPGYQETYVTGTKAGLMHCP